MKSEQVPVVIYVRASSDEQTTSCPDQLQILRKEAKVRGYKIVKEYTDDGLSGSKEIEKRIAFHEMIADSYKRDFLRVFVYDSSRFGRLDSQSAGEYKMKLRRNGVQGLDSYSEGVIDWTTQMGRLQDALLSEANYEAALKISRASIRGRMAQLVERATLPHGMIPYGYSRLYEGDGQKIVVPRHKSFRKPRSWTRSLIINEAEATVIREIYSLYVNQAKSIVQITKHLTNKGIPGWQGKAWSWNIVSRILRDKSYISYGSIKKIKCRKEAHNRMDPVEVPGVIPAILDDQLWHDAQRMLQQNGRTIGRTDRGNRALTGILTCGHCGHRLTARQRLRNGQHGPVFYTCGTAAHRGAGCPQWRVYECDVLPTIIRELVKVVDTEIISQLSPVAEATPDTSRQRKAVENLREQVKRATLRAVTADDELLTEYEAIAIELMRELKKEEEKLRMLTHVEQEGGPALWVEWWADVRPGLVLAADDPMLHEELAEAALKLPALKRVRGKGGFEEFRKRAGDTLVRLAPDGDMDPLRAILPVLLESGESGVVVEMGTLRGTLKKLGCTVSIYWRKNEQKVAARDPQWVIDRGQLKVDFRWSEHASPRTTRSAANAPVSRS